VAYAPEALDDLIGIYDWISTAASPDVALNYVERIETFCERLAFASERGTRRDDVRPGLRVIGFERRVSVAFVVEADRVAVLRIAYAGRNWTELVS
jgi:toxin ParE1/3/4